MGRLLAMVGGLLLAVALWAGIIPGLSGVIHEAESSWVDRVATMVEPAPERDDLVFLGVDAYSESLSALDPADREKSLLPELTKQWPWSRAVWAAAIERLAEAGAKLIVMDIAFDSLSDDAEADRALVDAIARYRSKVVLLSHIEPLPEGGLGGVRGTITEPHEAFLGPLDDETASGFANFWQSEDGNVRETVYRLSLREINNLERHPDEYVYESLAAVIGRKLGASPPEGSKRLRFAVRGKRVGNIKERRIENVYAPISFYKLFHEDDWKNEFQNGEFFRDKVVLIGTSGPIHQDVHATPAGTLDGGQLHLQAVGCLMANAFLRDAPAHWHWVGLIAMALVGALLVVCIKNPVWVFVLAGLAAGVWLCGVIYAANETSMLMGGIAGLLGLASVVLSGQSVEFLLERIERNRLFGQLSRSVSKDVAAAMVKSPDGYIDSAKGGRRRIVVLFSDVRDFTARSERQNPEDLVAQLNEYLSRMVDIIFKHGGTLDKFIGDAIMATWGGLEDARPDVLADEAVTAATEMTEDLERLNAKWKEEGREGFQAGIGIHIGEAVVGEVGSRARSDFTAIGDAVNLASRIEGMTKMMGVSILVSGEIAALQPGREGLCSLGRFRVKGRREAVEIAAASVGNEEDFREALEHFERGDLALAEGTLREISAESDLAGPAEFYLRRMQNWKEIPAEEWDGVVTLDSK